MKIRIFYFSFTFALGGICVSFLTMGMEIESELIMWLAIVSFLLYEYYCHREWQKEFEKTWIYKQLHEYMSVKNPSAKLSFYKNDCYNGRSYGKSHVQISNGWYEHISEHPEHIEFAKSTICHELYHLKFEHPLFSLKNIARRFYSDDKKNQCFIEEWREEFEADRYGYEIYENKEVYIEKMKFCRENASPIDKSAKSDHPTWDMRIRYIVENIEPTLEQVTKEFNEYYGI